MSDHEARKLAIAWNVATNGRLFCALLALINLSAHNQALAVASVVPIGASCLLDPLPESRFRMCAQIAMQAFGALVAIATLINVW